MESLVCYGESSEDSEEETQNGSQKNEEKPGGEKTRNFLLESGSASSKSSSESEREEEQQEPADDARGRSDSPSESLLPPVLSSSSHKLPPPPLGGARSGGLLTGSSVFANPFKERAEEKLSVLQKHVPLTLQARPTQIHGKKMCVAYRKDGRCRFGIRCKFAHDSDLQGTSGVHTEPAGSENGPEVDQTDPNPASSQSSDCRSAGLERNEVNEDEEEENRKRKKHRVGLSDTLIPPKRALKQYAMHRDHI